MMDNIGSQDKTRVSSYAVIAIVAALGLIGVVAVTIITISQQRAEAGCVTGYFNSGNKSALFTAFEKSEGRCLG